MNISYLIYRWFFEKWTLGYVKASDDKHVKTMKLIEQLLCESELSSISWDHWDKQWEIIVRRKEKDQKMEADIAFKAKYKSLYLAAKQSIANIKKLRSQSV